MGFEAPPAGTPLSEPALATGQLRAVPDLGKLLAVGNVATVQVAYDPSDQSKLGILFNGKFFPALVPENVSAGTKLSVTVLENVDAVVLKILNQIQSSPQKPTARSTAALEKLYPNLMQDLNLLFSEEPPKELNFVLAPLREEIQKFVAKALADQHSPDSAKNIVVKSTVIDSLPLPPTPAEKSVSSELEKILEKVFARGAVLNSATLGEPEKTFEALLDSAKSSLFKNVNEAKEALQKLSGKSLPAEQVQLLKTIEIELKKVLDQIPAPPVSVPQPQTVQVKSGETGVETTPITTHTLPELPPELERTISVLLEALKKIKIKTSKEEPIATGELQKLLFQLTTELEAAEVKKAPEAMREVINKTLRAMKEKFGIEKFTPEESKEIQTSMRALNGLESLLSAQDTLNQLNPVMDAIGEPILILFPMLTAGMLSKMKLSAEHPKVDPEEQKKNQGRSGNDLTRLRFSLELPSIGPVEINLAYGKGELFASFTFEDNEIANFAKAELPKLSSRFNALGFPSVTLMASSGRLKDVTPNWVRDLTIRDGVVA